MSLRSTCAAYNKAMSATGSNACATTHQPTSNAIAAPLKKLRGKIGIHGSNTSRLSRSDVKKNDINIRIDGNMVQIDAEGYCGNILRSKRLQLNS